MNGFLLGPLEVQRMVASTDGTFTVDRRLNGYAKTRMAEVTPDVAKALAMLSRYKIDRKFFTMEYFAVQYDPDADTSTYTYLVDEKTPINASGVLMGRQFPVDGVLSGMKQSRWMARAVIQVVSVEVKLCNVLSGPMRFRTDKVDWAYHITFKVV